ncbi:hypothetical protein TrLO_g3289 [Triparma laevis f. longispina]|uniref:Uncharacterized protein n=1 Tax=Triparma laevis f. longispina TaxID=1714387 RepID=A0A9W7FTJ2_9STRA|nr:hypothetical protein TrLO_g3289 [Triparma laevis f. longispina]
MSGEGPCQWQFYAQPHHQAKVGCSLAAASSFHFSVTFDPSLLAGNSPPSPLLESSSSSLSPPLLPPPTSSRPSQPRRLFPPIHPAHFSYTTVLQRFRQLRSVSPTITVAETLIKHSIFGSVGQIEKMESLFAARIHPEEPLSNIGDSLMKQLIMWIRDFDIYWMQC